MSHTVDAITRLHEALGGPLFLLLSALLSALLCFYAIPVTTDLMVNNSAGLVGKHIGRRYRTLVINASTNSPEAFSMIVSFAVGLFGGWANPLGSLFANVYLMYLVAPIVVIGLFVVRGGALPRQLPALLWRERRLVVWHLALGLSTMVAGRLALELMMGTFSGVERGATLPSTGGAMWIAMALIAVSIGIFVLFDRRLHGLRPELYEEIDESDHGESWGRFGIGTVGLILSTGLMNALFYAWSVLYHESLAAVFGSAVFAALHFFVGALITSLPELRVACRNYGRLTIPDLHTALGSATYSNLTNLGMALVGLMFFALLALSGIILPWGG